MRRRTFDSLLLPVRRLPLHRRLSLLIAVMALATAAIAVGSAPRAAEAAGNCDPNPQFVDCLTPPLGVKGSVQGSTLTLAWTYDSAVFTERGQPIGLSIYNAGAFGVKTTPVHQEPWSTAQRRTSFPVPNLAPGEHAFYVCLNYRTLVTYTDGTKFESYPELCPQLPAGGTIGGGSSPPAPRQAPRFTKHEADQTGIKVWWSADRKYEFFNVSWIPEGLQNGPEHSIGCDCADGYMHITTVDPGRVYDVIVKGCDENFFGDQSCSPWSAARRIEAAPRPLPKPSITQAPRDHPMQIAIRFGDVDQYKLTSATLKRDDKVVYDAKQAGDYIPEYTDSVPRANAEYTYQLCVGNSVETLCSDRLKAMAKPVAPTAPADVRATVQLSGGGSNSSGSIQGRPKRNLSVTWRNTEIAGQFITVEGQDLNASGGNGRVTGPLKRWIELKRVTAKDDPTSMLMDVPLSLIIANSELTTYRVCAVVPKLGDAGKVCSGPVSLP